MLSLGGFFCEAPLPRHSDKKFRCKAKNGVFREIKEIREIREYRVIMSFGRLTSFGFNSK